MSTKDTNPWWRTTKRKLFKALFPSELKAGATVKFSDGSVYQKQRAGNIKKVFPLKPWANKAEHKQHKKLRREKREGSYGTYDQATSAIPVEFLKKG